MNQAEDDLITLGPTGQPRQDWEKALRAMAERGDDQLLDKDVLAQTRWDKTEWDW